MSRRRGFLSLGMIVLMLALPWTAVADSGGRGNEDASEKVKITAQKEEVQNRVEIEVEFENLTDYITYNYEITITRVDPDFVHKKFTGDFTTESEVYEYTITAYWTPDQEGPYTIHSSLIQYEGIVATGSSSFGWGDVANNSDPANAGISADPELSHYDTFGNDTLAENVFISIARVHTENGASYQIKWSFYEGDDVEQDNYILGETAANIQSRTFALSTFNTYLENNTNYTVAGWLYRVDSDGDGGQTNVEVALDTWTFTIGEEPELTIQPVISGCTDVNATNHDPDATEDDGSCIFPDSDGDGVYDHLEIDGCTNANATNYDADATDDDGSCIFLDSDGDGVYNHLEIAGCTDEEALNQDEDATDDDGSCTYPNPLQVELTANQTMGEVPLTVTFVAEISEGRSPYQISWEFGDGTFAEDLVSVDHTFYTAGVYNIILLVTDSDEEEIQRTVPIIVSEPPEIDELTGYISHSGQLDPINKDMVASIEFYATVSGGEGPYTYTWKFGDDNGGSGSTVLHEYATGGEFLVELIVEDSVGRTLQLGEIITIIKEGGEGGGIAPPLEEVGGGDSNFDIYATSTGAIGLLLMFGLFGRKRRDSFLDAERRKAQGEGSMWD